MGTPVPRGVHQVGTPGGTLGGAVPFWVPPGVSPGVHPGLGQGVSLSIFKFSESQQFRCSSCARHPQGNRAAVRQVGVVSAQKHSKSPQGTPVGPPRDPLEDTPRASPGPLPRDTIPRTFSPGLPPPARGWLYQAVRPGVRELPTVLRFFCFFVISVPAFSIPASLFAFF